MWTKVNKICILLLNVLHLADTGAVFTLQFLTFDNGGERDWYGNCCDTLCIGSCDPFFVICLDKDQGNMDFKSCDLYRGTTKAYSNTNLVRFGADMGPVPNPIILNFESWPGRFMLKMDVYDSDDTSNHDELDKYYRSFSVKPTRQDTAPSYVQYTLMGARTKTKPSSTVVQLMVYCEQNFYGPQCDVECYGRDDEAGHYMCEPDTGQWVCLPGWQNVTSNCTMPTDECTDLHIICQNGGTCVDGFLNYTCMCTSGYFGDYCERHVCDDVTCYNGGVCVGMGQCACTTGFYGAMCQNATIISEKPDEEIFPLWATIVIAALGGLVVLDILLVTCRRCCCKKAGEDLRHLVHYNPTYDDSDLHGELHVTQHKQNVYTIEYDKWQDNQNGVYEDPDDVYSVPPLGNARLVLQDGAFPDNHHPPPLPPVDPNRKPFVRTYDTTFTEWIKGSLSNFYTRIK